MSKSQTYIIRDTVAVYDGEHSYWSNVDGWVAIQDADVFTEQERAELNLPVGGEWIAEGEV
jgi:hypothetical protein